MLLIRQGLEMLDVAREESDKSQENLRNRIEDSEKELREVRGNTEAQALAVRENNSMLRKLFWMVRGDIAAPLKALSQAVAKVCVSTQQIYTIVLEIRTNLVGADTRFTFFQAPVKVEDVLGRVFPFPSECSVEALNTEIKYRFKQGHGKAEVMAGNYEIFDAQNSDQVLLTFGSSALLPGMSVYMAIVLENAFEGNERCPMPRCPSTSFVHAIGGGKTCSECNVWFDKRQKSRKRKFEEEENTEHIEHVENTARRDRNFLRSGSQSAPDFSNDERLVKGSQLRSAGTSMRAFKRVRLENSLQSSTLHEIFKLLDGNLQMGSSPMEFHRLLRDLYSRQSKWASESRIGQQELYEAAEVVLLKLIDMKEDPDLLTRIREKHLDEWHSEASDDLMDLETMMERLRHLEYASKQQLVDDLNLIWAHCESHAHLPLVFDGDPPLIAPNSTHFTQTMADKLIPLIPNIVVRDRAEVEAEERRMANINADDDEDDSDDEPIMSSRGRMAPSVHQGYSTLSNIHPLGFYDSMSYRSILGLEKYDPNSEFRTNNL